MTKILFVEYLKPLEQTKTKISSLDFIFDDIDIDDPEKTITTLNIDRSVKRSNFYSGGTIAAEKTLQEFLSTKLDRFSELRNQPGDNFLSNLSPYLHFGQISPIYIALKAKMHGGPGLEAYLEELIVRRELSMNFVNYNSEYDSFKCLPEWAKTTLSRHGKDKREYIR